MIARGTLLALIAAAAGYTICLKHVKLPKDRM